MTGTNLLTNMSARHAEKHVMNLHSFAVCCSLNSAKLAGKHGDTDQQICNREATGGNVLQIHQCAFAGLTFYIQLCKVFWQQQQSGFCQNVDVLSQVNFIDISPVHNQVILCRLICRAGSMYTTHFNLESKHLGTAFCLLGGRNLWAEPGSTCLDNNCYYKRKREGLSVSQEVPRQDKPIVAKLALLKFIKKCIEDRDYKIHNLITEGSGSHSTVRASGTHKQWISWKVSLIIC